MNVFDGPVTALGSVAVAVAGAVAGPVAVAVAVADAWGCRENFSGGGLDVRCGSWLKYCC